MEGSFMPKPLYPMLQDGIHLVGLGEELMTFPVYDFLFFSLFSSVFMKIIKSYYMVL